MADLPDDSDYVELGSIMVRKVIRPDNQVVIRVEVSEDLPYYDAVALAAHALTSMGEVYDQIYDGDEDD